MMTFRTILFVILGSELVIASVLESLDNEMMGPPLVECEANSVRVSIRTKRPFLGRIFMRGNSHKPECVRDFSDRPGIDVNVTVDYSQCNTERVRRLSPNGVSYANTLVMQFHKTFITNIDKVFNVRCFYAETQHSVASNFQVSNLPTTVIAYDLEQPDCVYTVRRDSLNGPLVKTARVGDIVYHRWECRGNTDVYGMLVHSCFVEDTQGQQTKLIDGLGCAIDPLLLPDLTYSQDQAIAYRNTQVFKYPDHSFVNFKCQVKICTRVDGNCLGVTPPACDEKRRKARRDLENVGKATKTHNGRFSELPSIDLIAPLMLIVDKQDDLFESDDGARIASPVSFNKTMLDITSLNEPVSGAALVSSTATASESDWSLCFNRQTMISALAAFCFVTIAQLFIVFYMCYHWRR